MATSEPLLVVANLTVKFARWSQNVTALQDVSVEVAPGEWVLVVGPNGSGKSTLLNIISGTLPYTIGSVQITGDEVSTTPRRALSRRVFHVHQNPLAGTAPGLTVEENLRVAAERILDGDGERSPGAAFQSWLEPLGLHDRLKQPVDSLSGGERQLLALLIGRLRNVPLLLLDEPLAALDPGKAEAGLAEIRRLHADGRTIIQVTHDPEQIGKHKGRVVAVDKVRIEG